MLITQRQAIKRLRQETGMSIAWCETRVRAMANHRDGQRMKVLSSHLDGLISDTNHPEPRRKVNGIRPLSAKKRQKLRELCI